MRGWRRAGNWLLRRPPTVASRARRAAAPVVHHAVTPEGEAMLEKATAIAAERTRSPVAGQRPISRSTHRSGLDEPSGQSCVPGHWPPGPFRDRKRWPQFREFGQPRSAVPIVHANVA
jgi:hypothetical protein